MKKPKKGKPEEELDNEEFLEDTIEEISEEITEVIPSDIAPLETKELEIIEKKSKDYWTEETEKAVVDYLNFDFVFLNNKLMKLIEESKKKSSKVTEYDIEDFREQIKMSQDSDVVKFQQDIFRKKIQKPLNRLVENIIFNFKLFRSDVDIKTLHNDCVSFVYSKFSNFNPDQNTKSFSFFGTIAKHYLLGEKKDLDKSHKVNTDYDDVKDEADERKKYEIDKVSELDSSFSFFNHVIEEIESEISKEHISENDAKVGDAIISIFKHHESIGVYNKNQVYQLIKESTGLQTKDITYSLHRFRIFYRLMKQDFLKDSEE